MFQNSLKLEGVSMMLKSGRNLGQNFKLLTIMITSDLLWTPIALKLKCNLCLNANTTIGSLET